MQVVYASRLYVIQTIKKNSTADISISFMLFTIYKEIQKISGIPEISRKLASLLFTTQSCHPQTNQNHVLLR